MKKNILIKGVAAVIAAGSLGSCSSDYLQLAPETAITQSTVQTTVEGAQLALYGVCRAMYMAYSTTESRLFAQGESGVMTYYGDVCSADYMNWLWGRNGTTFNDWSYFQDKTTWIPSYPWMYSYNLIAQANTILEGIDTAKGDEKTRDFIKAQALTIRAHGYWRLLQCYAPRWEDSDNGAALACVLREKPGVNSAPLVDMNTILRLIYSDLDTAIELYQTCGKSRVNIWEPDITVAQATYARVAILKHDYPKAQEMAKAARAKYHIMSPDEYKAGFAEANDEWMWCNYAEDVDPYTGYWSWGAWYACNGGYVAAWGMGSGCISIDLYREVVAHFGKDDIRTKLFWTPDALDDVVPASVKRRLNGTMFWNDRYIDPSSMNMNGLQVQMTRSIEYFGNEMTPGGDPEKWGRRPYTPDSENTDGAFVIPFGAQYKFWGKGTYSNSQVPFLRASEMLLTEAEAAYYNNDLTTARACLEELNSKRTTGYSCNLSGQALLDEIRLTRRIELWGEGQNWFDYKRWNIPMERRAWVKDDPTSGNWPATLVWRHETDFSKGWTMCIPMSESEYNDDIR
jgi:putative susD/ragB family protein (fragment)